jgi:hypothetical protein
MKKAMNLLSAACAIAIASAFAACSSDALVNEEAPAKEQEKVSLTVKATQGSRMPDTRLVYTPSDDGKSMDVKWGVDETLGVVTYDGSNLGNEEHLTSTNTEAAASATFTGTASASSNGKYNFYYYPPVSSASATISDNTITMDMSHQGYYFDNSSLTYYNLMYTKQAVDPSTETVELYHAFALIRLVLTLPAEAVSIDSIALSTWEPVFPTKAKLTYDAAGGAVLTYEGSTDRLTIITPEDYSSGTRTINAYMMVPEVKEFTGQLCKVTVTDKNMNTFSYVYNLTGNTDKTAAVGNITPQKLYTFTATLKEDRWAGSNIYWDGTKLTFDDPSKMGKSAAQGLFFKWGSLQGISPVGAWAGGSTPVYSTTAQGTAASWEAILYDNVTADDGTLDSDHDICQQISEGNYRMPTKDELDYLDKNAKRESIGGSTTTEAVDGTRAIYSGGLYDNLVFLPNSGAREIDGSLVYVGEAYTTNWSNTAYLDDAAYYISSIYDRTSAMPIRCIKKLASEE